MRRGAAARTAARQAERERGSLVAQARGAQVVREQTLGREGRDGTALLFLAEPPPRPARALGHRALGDGLREAREEACLPRGCVAG